GRWPPPPARGGPGPATPGGHGRWAAPPAGGRAGFRAGSGSSNASSPGTAVPWTRLPVSRRAFAARRGGRGRGVPSESDHPPRRSLRRALVLYVVLVTARGAGALEARGRLLGLAPRLTPQYMQADG